jgi:hypothetical protein
MAMLLLAALAGCGETPDATSAVPAGTSPPADRAPLPRKPLIGEHLARAEWAKAANRAGCHPLGLAGDGGAGGTARRANFAGGWAVAFDRPGLRSAYGFAGTGVPAAGREQAADGRPPITEQWPYLRTLTNLPGPAIAGYGLGGAVPYPADDPSGVGRESLAYVEIGGQACLYNVWSRLGRSHLERLLDALRLLPVPA